MTRDADYVLEEASVQYGDWVGTAAADEHMTTGHGDLYELVGLDDDRWWIVAFDFVSETEFYVYAIDRQATGIHDHNALVAYEAEHGAVAVTSFLVHNMSPARLLGRLTSWHIQMRSRALEGRDLRVTRLEDLRYSEDD